MSKHFYPAVFTKESDGYSVVFPDLEGCFTEGDTLEETYGMASEAVGLYAECQDGKGFFFPEASSPQEIKCNENEFVVLIEFDELEYIKKHDTRSVKKTLTIPSWLNVAAEKSNVNFSGILQNALMEYLHID